MTADALPVSAQRAGDLFWRFAPYCVAALALTLWAPLWLLLLSPLLFGVPHVAADLRYLVFSRQGLGWPLWLPLTLLTAARVVAVLGGPSHPTLEVLLGLGAVAGSVARADSARRGASLALLSLLAAIALAWPDRIALTLGHLHNWIAIGLWLAWARASRTTVAAVASLLTACGVAVVFGPALVAPAAGLDLTSLTEALAPGLEPGLALRLVLLFAFAQALHYAVWLVLLPAAAQVSPRQSWREALGPLGFGATVTLSAAVLLAGSLAPAETRAVYLSLVVFHGWLEIAVLARWAVAPRSAPWSQ